MQLFLDDVSYIDTSEPLDISNALKGNDSNLKAWYVAAPTMLPVMENGFVGEVALGGSVNFRNIFFNPHGHMTHTECLGHITEEIFSVNKVVKEYFCKAIVVSIQPEERIHSQDAQTDQVITFQQLNQINWPTEVEALIIRTLPNNKSKCHIDYSAKNPPYLEVDCANLLLQRGIKHLLIDTPSVDRELDGGELAFHHAFWEVPKVNNKNRTITELIYVPDEVMDGIYVMDLQIAPFENDAAPSRPVLYKIKKRG